MSIDDDRESMGKLLAGAFPPDKGYVTRAEFVTALENIEERMVSSEAQMMLRLKNSEVTQRNWILSGCLAIIVAFGSGYISIVTRLDQLSNTLPGIQLVLEDRRIWAERQDQRDNIQDTKLKQLDKTYEPLPYRESPK